MEDKRQPSIVQPQLNGTNRLTQRRLIPSAGNCGEKTGVPIGGGAAGLPDRNRQVSRARSKKASAVRLAKVVRINAKAYAKKVTAAGNNARSRHRAAYGFTGPATRLEDPRNPGALIRTDEMLAPTYDFARPIIGTVGEATKENIDESGGAVVAGDQVGLQDCRSATTHRMRGTPGVLVRLAAAKPSDSSASPSPTPSPTAEAEAVVLFEVSRCPANR